MMIAIFSCIGTCLFYVAIIYVIHELGHVLAVLAVGGRVVGFEIGWRGVGVRWRGGGGGDRCDNGDPCDHCDSHKQIVVALSGPVANLVAFTVCGFSTFGLCNLVFAVANLMLPGGDGARVVRILRLRGEY